MNKIVFPVLTGWKGILAILIAMLHFEGIFIGRQEYFETGYLAVDCFFIISGFLLMQSIWYVKQEEHPLRNILVKRIRKIYPPYIASIVFILLGCIMLPAFRRYITVQPEALFGEIFMLQLSGLFPFQLVNGVDWYVSALIISTVIISVFCLLRQYIYIYNCSNNNCFDLFLVLYTGGKFRYSWSFILDCPWRNIKSFCRDELWVFSILRGKLYA